MNAVPYEEIFSVSYPGGGPRWANYVHLENENIRVGTQATIYIVGGIIGRNFDESDFSAVGDYVHFLSVNGNDITVTLAKSGGQMANPDEKGKIVILSQRLINAGWQQQTAQVLRLDLQVGNEVQLGTYDIDVNIGELSESKDPISQGHKGKNGSHRMKQVLRVVDLQWARPSTSDAADPGVGIRTVALSSPIPGIALDPVASPSVSPDGTVSLTVSGSVRDPIADCEEGPSPVYQTLSVTVDGASIGSVQVSEQADGAAGLWRPFPRKGSFTKQVSFPAKAGLHSVRLTTAENAAALSASCCSDEAERTCASAVHIIRATESPDDQSESPWPRSRPPAYVGRSQCSGVPMAGKWPEQAGLVQ